MSTTRSAGFRLGIYVFKDAEIIDYAAPYGVFSVARRFDPELDAFLRSSSHLGKTACLIESDILLKEIEGRCFSGVQEDDGDGKIPVSALTRRAGHWSGGDS